MSPCVKNSIFLTRYQENVSGVGYSLDDPDVIFTLWDDVLVALREGEAPQQSEVLAEISTLPPQLEIFNT